MPVLEARNRSFAAQHQRRDSGTVADPLGHHLVETDARVDLGLRHGCAAEHVPRLHAVDNPVVGLLVPQTTQEDQPLLPGLERLQAWPEFHRSTLTLGPPVIRVEAHAGEGDERAGRRLIGGVGSHTRSEGQRFQPGQSHRNAEPTQQGTSREVGRRCGGQGNVLS